jgi:uncharacterized RDD family membrane protein YckC|tara:strand:+ start:510 stop:914 length:405 start_codon:yes stop_codon:yes gene_type:complete
LKINFTGRLFACLFYELIIQIGLWFVVTFIILAVFNADLTSNSNLLRFILWFSSGIYFISSWFYGGQTLAMKAWKLRIIFPEDNKNFSYVLSRYFLASISIAFFGLGFFYIFFDKKNRNLHDRILGFEIIYIQI